jgi:hypothetical protein
MSLMREVLVVGLRTRPVLFEPLAQIPNIGRAFYGSTCECEEKALLLEENLACL